MTDFKVQSMREALEQVYNPSDILEEYDEENVQQLNEVWFLAPGALAIATTIGGATLKTYKAWKKASKIKEQAAKAAKLRKQLEAAAAQAKKAAEANKKKLKQGEGPWGPRKGEPPGKTGGSVPSSGGKLKSTPSIKRKVATGTVKHVWRNKKKYAFFGGAYYLLSPGDEGYEKFDSENPKHSSGGNTPENVKNYGELRDKMSAKDKKSAKDKSKGDVFMGPRPTVFGPKERGKKVQDDIMKMRKELGGYGMPKHHSQTMTATQRKERKPTFEPDKPEPKDKKNGNGGVATDYEGAGKEAPQEKMAAKKKEAPSKISTLIQKRKDKKAKLAKTGKGPDAYKVAGEKRQQDRLDPNRSDAKAKRKESEKPLLNKKQQMAQRKIDSLPTHTAAQREYKQKTQREFDKHLKKTNENFELNETMSSSQISQLKKAFEPMRGKRISMSSGDKLRKILDKVSDDKNTLVQLYKADIPFVSQGAATRLISKHDVKGAELNAMSEEIMLDEKISGLVKKSDKSGISYGTLKKVYDRGMAAWKTGHRPGTTPQQWAFARVNSFITKGKGTWGGADKDLAKQVKEEAEMHESLWANIHAKRARGEKMRKKGEKGAPTEAQMARAKAASEDFKVENMRDAMKEVWKNGVKMQEKRKEKENGLRVLKAGKTMTGGKPAYVELKPKLDTRARP